MKSKAPWLIVHSVKDELVDLSQSTDFVKHLQDQKISVQFMQLKNESHFAAVESLNDPATDATKAVLAFVSAHKK